MKSSLFSLLVILCFSVISFAQPDAYLTAMKQGITLLETKNDANQYQEAVNLFSRVAAAEPGKWLPNYYLAYSHIQLAVAEMEKQEMEACTRHLDAAQSALDAAREVAPEEAEIIALQSFIYQGRIWGDPQTNGPKYSPLAMAAAQKAMGIAPDNPRPHHLIGQNLFFTPTFWGGGPEVARPHLEKAAERFAAFEPASELHPDWGAEFNAYMLSEAEKAAGNE